ncbi:hypothetical protein [Mycolicibacterium vaccae]|uniref:hypothetical protein n=1 Tax=Mycolicibacterium vaccae TaxID=1810 RepID=UPI003D036D4D
MDSLRVDPEVAFGSPDGATTAEEWEEQVDRGFSFLSSAESELLHTVVARRDPALYERLEQESSVSQQDADAIVNVLGDELVNSLDGDWEPTEWGLTVSALLARFNAARIAEWP